MIHSCIRSFCGSVSVICLIWSSSENALLSFVPSLLKSFFSFTVAGKLKFSGFFLLPPTLDICCCVANTSDRAFFLLNITRTSGLLTGNIGIHSRVPLSHTTGNLYPAGKLRGEEPEIPVSKEHYTAKRKHISITEKSNST